MAFGKVKSWDENKGFGILTTNHGGEDLHFDRKELPAGHDISLGQVLKYDLGKDRLGRAVAVNINNSRTFHGDSSGGSLGSNSRKWWQFWK